MLFWAAGNAQNFDYILHCRWRARSHVHQFDSRLGRRPCREGFAVDTAQVDNPSKVKVGAYESRQKMPRQATLSDLTSDVVSCLLLHAKIFNVACETKLYFPKVKLESRHYSHTTQNGGCHKLFHSCRQQAWNWVHYVHRTGVQLCSLADRRGMCRT